MQIAHIMIFEKFNRRYIEFVAAHFPVNDHRFYIIGTNYAGYNLEGLPNVRVINSYIKVLSLFSQLLFAKRIFLHGLWHRGFIKLLLLQPWLIKKCYWMMWGGDFYYHDKETPAKKKLIKKIRHFVSLVEGDYQLAQKWYEAKGTFHQSILYTYIDAEEFDQEFHEAMKPVIRILAGNSADPSNRHAEIFELLLPYKDRTIEIIMPLSYGNVAYANEICKKGNELFGEKFKGLTHFIPMQEYRQLLRETDIGIFYHNRQQGLGNIITLLSYGKKVYLNPEVTTWRTFTQLGVELFDAKTFEPELLDEKVRQRNRMVMKQYFSASHYKEQLSRLFLD